MKGRLLGLFVALVGVSSCVAPQPSLTPEAGLVELEHAINRIIEEDARYAVAPLPPVDAERTSEQVTFWYFRHPLMGRITGDEALMSNFTTAHPTVSFAPQYIGEWHVAVNKLMVSIAANESPDIALVNHGWLTQLAASGKLADLNTLLPESLLADLLPEVRSAYSIGAHLYALPADGFCEVLYYDSAKIQTPPKTWDELSAIGATQSTPTTLGWMNFQTHLMAAGGKVCDETRSRVNSPEALVTLHQFLSWRDSGFTTPDYLMSQEQSFQLLSYSERAITTASSEFMPLAHTISTKSIRVAAVPGPKGPTSMFCGGALVVFAQNASARREQITAVLDFLTGPSIQGESAVVLGSHPIRKSVREKVVVDAGLSDAFAIAQPRPMHASWARIDGALQETLWRIYRHTQITNTN